MKKLILSTLIIGTTTLTVFTGCKKDDSSSGSSGNGGGSNKSVTDRLTGGTSRKWKQVSETHNGTPTTQDPCDVDDRAIFTKSGNAMTMDFGSVHCDPNEPANMTGNWALSNNDKTLTLNMTYMTIPVTVSFDIVNLTDAQLITKEIDQGDTTVTTFNVTN